MKVRQRDFLLASKRPMKKLILSCSLILMTLTFITGCNTISGAGKDVSVVGSDVSSAANTVAHKMSNQ
jgi:predicted small secreted protein